MNLQTISDLLEDRQKTQAFWHSSRLKFEIEKEASLWFPKKFSVFQKWLKGLQTFYDIAAVLNKKVTMKDNIFLNILETSDKENPSIFGDSLISSDGLKRTFSNVENTSSVNSFSKNKSLMRHFNKNYFMYPVSADTIQEAKDFVAQYITAYYLYVVRHDIEEVKTNHVLASMLLEAVSGYDPNISAFSLYREKLPNDLQSLMFVYKAVPPRIDTQVLAFLHSVPKDKLFNFSFFSKGTFQSDIETYMKSVFFSKNYPQPNTSGVPVNLFSKLET